MKTLVNIITEDNPIPAYLFIKEKYEEGDRIMYISAKDTEDDLDWLAEIDGVSASQIDEIVLKNDIDEFKYEKICRAVKAYLKKEVHYCVNLAGGTRYMALAVQQVFEDYDSEFFYVNLEDNTIVKSKFDNSIYDNDDYFYPIKYRMNIAEYLSAHELQHDIDRKKKPLYSFEMSANMFKHFSKQLFQKRDYDVMTGLRSIISEHKRIPSIPELARMQNMHSIREFLELIEMPVWGDKLTYKQIAWITGGWFEEYMYYRVNETIQPDEITLGIRISRKESKLRNELDVVFIKNNRLFVIECKTGVETERKFNEIVYKACALREALLGVSCYSYIASLKHDNTTDDLKKIASNMDITFWDNEILVNHLDNTLNEIKQQTVL